VNEPLRPDPALDPSSGASTDPRPTGLPNALGVGGIEDAAPWRPNTSEDDEPVDILIVDDRPENLLALEALLEPLGQRIVAAHSGDEALRHLLVRDFALILLDVQMPGLNGFETAQLIKARERSRHIPIIFLTAINKEEQYVFQGYEVGAVDYLFKPFNPDVLRSKVAVFVDLHHARERIRRQERALRESERRTMELTNRASLLEQEARSAEQLAELNRELQERQAELENAMLARSRFYASMSHELRTPINAILGYNTLLLDGIYGPLDEQQQRGIERTHKAARHLLELVNDVLDLSKIEAGKFDLTVQPTAFPALIEDLFVTVRPLADEHGCQLTLHSEIPSTVIDTDPRRVRQVLLNLLSNAIKFGHGRPIEVACRIVGERDAGHGDGQSDPSPASRVPRPDSAFLEVAVCDHGPGISPVDLPRIFDEFVQLEHAARAQQDTRQIGTGLGLPISKRLADLLGGSLEAESTLGRGSTFRLVIPMRRDEADESRSEPGDRRGAVARPADAPTGSVDAGALKGSPNGAPNGEAPGAEAPNGGAPNDAARNDSAHDHAAHDHAAQDHAAHGDDAGGGAADTENRQAPIEAPL
jgi:two-component system, sensor histidine kinase